MSIKEKLKDLDYVNYAMYACFVLAVLFYFLSGKISGAFRTMFLIAVFFLLVGVVLLIIKLYKTYSVTNDLYRTRVQEKRLKLYEEYGNLSSEAEKELKEYKKTALKDYRNVNRRYVLYISILGLMALYIAYYGLSILINW